MPSLQRHGLDLGQKLSVLSQLSAGLSAGQLQAFVQQLAAEAAAAASGTHGISGAGTNAAWQAGEGGSALGTIQAEAAVQDVSEVAAAVQQAQQAAGQAPCVQQEMRAGTRQGRQRQGAPTLDELALQLLPGFAPCSLDEVAALREWTVRVHQPLPPEVRQSGGGSRFRVVQAEFSPGAASSKLASHFELCCTVPGARYPPSLGSWQ